MSTTYNPNGTLPAVTAFAPVAIATASNTTPISIVTSAPHGFADGDTVQIVACSDAGANGMWVIHVTAANRFTLNGSTADGGGTGGIVTDYSVNPLLTLPADGDTMNASSVNVPLEGTSNAIPFLYQRTGAYRVVDRQVIHVTDDTWAAWATLTTAGTGTWESLGATLFSGYALPGDLLDVRATVNGGCTVTPATFGALGVMVYGSTLIAGSGVVVPNNTATIQTYALQASYGVSGSPGGASYTVGLAAYSNAPGNTYALTGHRSIIFTQYRSNA